MHHRGFGPGANAVLSFVWNSELASLNTNTTSGEEEDIHPGSKLAIVLEVIYKYIYVTFITSRSNST